MRRLGFSLPGILTIAHLSAWLAIIGLGPKLIFPYTEADDYIIAFLASPLALLIAPRGLANEYALCVIVVLNSLLVGHALSGALKKITNGKIRIRTLLALTAAVAVACLVISFQNDARSTLLTMTTAAFIWLALENYFGHSKRPEADRAVGGGPPI